MEHTRGRQLYGKSQSSRDNNRTPISFARRDYAEHEVRTVVQQFPVATSDSRTPVATHSFVPEPNGAPPGISGVINWFGTLIRTPDGRLATLCPLRLNPGIVSCFQNTKSFHHVVVGQETLQ
jgi:hypothetical protein